MLNVPFLSTTAPMPEASKPAKVQEPERNTRESDFEDAYDATGTEATDDPAPVEEKASDDTPEKSKDVPQDQAAPEQDGAVEPKRDVAAPTEVAETAVREETDTKFAEVSKAESMKPSVEGQKAAPAPQATTALPVQAKATEVSPLDPKSKPVPVAQKVETISVETAEELAPMRVSVKASAPAEAVAARAALAQQVKTQAPTGQSVEIEEAPVAANVKDVAPIRPTTEGVTAPQWRVESVSNTAQNAVQTMANAQPNLVAEVEVPQAAETLAGGREEVQVRQMASGLDLMQQSRMTQTTHNPVHVVRQLAEAVRTSDGGLIELAMDPPELGRVRMSMTEVAGVMNVSISAENPATTDLMRRHIDLLRRDFVELGYENVSFSFEQGDTHQGQGDGDIPWADNLGEPEGDAPAQMTQDADPVPAAPIAASDGGVDIRI